MVLSGNLLGANHDIHRSELVLNLAQIQVPVEGWVAQTLIHLEVGGTSDAEHIGVTYKQLPVTLRGSPWPDIQGPSVSLLPDCLFSPFLRTAPPHTAHPPDLCPGS